MHDLSRNRSNRCGNSSHNDVYTRHKGEPKSVTIDKQTYPLGTAPLTFYPVHDNMQHLKQGVRKLHSYVQ